MCKTVDKTDLTAEKQLLLLYVQFLKNEYLPFLKPFKPKYFNVYTMIVSEKSVMESPQEHVQWLEKSKIQKKENNCGV